MNPFNDEYFMKQALVEARAAAAEGEVPVGAVVVCNNQIIARAHNQTERLNDPTAPCGNAGYHSGCRCIGGKISDRMQFVCYGRTLYYVCRSDRMVATKYDCVRCKRREKRISGICSESFSPEGCCKKRCNGERVCGRDAEILPATAGNGRSARRLRLLLTLLLRSQHIHLRLLRRSSYGWQLHNLPHWYHATTAVRQRNCLSDDVVLPSFRYCYRYRTTYS